MNERSISDLSAIKGRAWHYSKTKWNFEGLRKKGVKYLTSWNTRGVIELTSRSTSGVKGYFYYATCIPRVKFY